MDRGASYADQDRLAYAMATLAHADHLMHARCVMACATAHTMPICD